MLPLEKAERDDGKWIIKGKASGLGVDQENYIMRPQAIQSMARSINESPVPFKDWHPKGSILGEDLGVVISAQVSPEWDLDVEVELDPTHPISQRIWSQIDKGKQYGMSVHGKAEDFKVEFEQSIGKNALAIYSVDIDEVSITTKPIWTPSLGTVIKKAIDEAESKSVDIGDISNMETPVQVGDVITVTDTNQPTDSEPIVAKNEEVVTSSAPENVVAASELVVVEKAVSTDTAREARKLAKLVTLHKQFGTLLEELELTVEPQSNSIDESSEPVTVEKSASDDDDRYIRLEKALNETRDQLEILKSQIPDTPIPGVLIRKNEVDEIREAMESMDPRERLLVGLAAMHNEER